ncbi:MAG: R3H domain-containing nucleic acid-binding protein [Candidatus Dormibacteria bacterium]
METDSGPVEGEGETVAEATAEACRSGGLNPDEVMVEVISQGGRALAGERITGVRARVRVRLLPEVGRRGRRNLEHLLRLMDIDAEVRPQPTSPGLGAETSYPVILEVEGMDLGVLIGWRGESLRALQTVLNLTLGDGSSQAQATRVIVDVAGYRQRREHAVAQLALRLAAGVVRSGRPATLEPMPPYERRAVHLALAGDPSVATQSVGVDAERRVVISPAGELQR